MLPDHDLHDCRERVPARLLPRQFWRGQRLGVHRSHLGRLHGDVYLAALGAKHRSGKGAWYSSGYHFRSEVCDYLPTVLWPAHQAMAGEEGACRTVTSLTFQLEIDHFQRLGKPYNRWVFPSQK